MKMVKDYSWAMFQLPPTPSEIEDLPCDVLALPSAAEVPPRLICESESLFREVLPARGAAVGDGDLPGGP